MSLSSYLWLLGLISFFLGERTFGTGSMRLVFAGLGLALLVVSTVLRFQRIGRSQHEVMKKGARQAFLMGLLGLSFLLLYGLSLDTVIDALGHTGEAELRWRAVFQSLAPIPLLAGTLPLLLLDRALSSARVIPAARLRHALSSGLSLAFGIALVFPLNYLAADTNQVWDVTYFRTTQPGEAVQNLVANLPEPVTVRLFFAPSDEVLAEALPYFTELASLPEAQGRLEVTVLDQAVERALAEELRVRKNGIIAISRGEQHETIDLGTELDRAKDDLEDLDGQVHEALMSLLKGNRVVYFTTGHGEGNRRDEDERRKLDVFEREIEALGFEVKNLGLVESLGAGVPDDAAVVVVAGPQTELHPGELEALSTFLDTGGRVWLMLEPGGPTLEPLTSRLGVTAMPGVMAAEGHFVRASGALSDRELQGTNRFGSHPSVTTLQRNSRMLAMLMPRLGGLTVERGGEARVSATVRTMPDTWVDLDGDFTFDEGDEEKRAHEVAVAVSGPEREEGDPWRAAVTANLGWASDWAFERNRANLLYLHGTLLWLVDDEDLVGEIASEEDVLIQHNTEEDRLWFWGSILGFPLAVWLFGAWRLRSRRKRPLVVDRSAA